MTRGFKNSPEKSALFADSPERLHLPGTLSRRSLRGPWLSPQLDHRGTSCRTAIYIMGCGPSRPALNPFEAPFAKDAEAADFSFATTNKVLTPADGLVIAEALKDHERLTSLDLAGHHSPTLNIGCCGHNLGKGYRLSLTHSSPTAH